MIRLGVNVDHIATLRQARGESYPDPVHGAMEAVLGGADNITCHLREDRRHIQDRDVELLRQLLPVPLNFEMAATAEMLAIATRIKPHSVTLVPEKRAERTTEGGLDLSGQFNVLKDAISRLKDSGILVALFIEPAGRAAEQSKQLAADAVEFHTGRFCHAIEASTTTAARHGLVEDLSRVARHAKSLGLQVHFGHGLNYQNAGWLQWIPEAEEANIGHAIIARSVFTGLRAAVSDMRELLNHPAHRP